MRYGTQKHLDYIKHRLQQKCKTQLRTTVLYVDDLKKFKKQMGFKVRNNVKNLGFCFEQGGRFFVVIENNMGFEIKAQTLVHEWAHLITPTKAPNHGRKWAEKYSKAYRVVYGVQ